MTRKRYNKLMYALMQRINVGSICQLHHPMPNCGRVLHEVKNKRIEQFDPSFKSYAQAWESLKPVRELYGM